MLVKLFSETDLLSEPFTFESGLNIILGKYSEDKEQRGINGIGKSSLVRLINYAFLSESSEKIFSKAQYDFLRKEGHNIVLEFKINNETHFIKRFFAKKDTVYFGTKPSNLEDYTKSELKKVLINKFFPVENNDVFFEGNKLGTIMSFFIKDDLENQKRVDPLNFLPYNPNLRDVAIYNFFLLNLSTKHIIRYDELAKEYDSYNKTIKGLQDKIKVDTGKNIEEYKTERIKIEQNISLLEKTLKDYKFLENYKNLEAQLIEVTTIINERLKTYYSLNNKHKKIRDSYHLSQEIDTKQIQKLYNEVLQTFGDLVTKTLNEISDFKKEIIENRNKFLIAKEKQLESSIKKTLDEISKLENKRSELYKKLDEKGALESIKNTYEQLTIEKSQLAGNIAILTQIDEIQEMLSNLDITISEIKRDMLSELKKYEKPINSLRTLFQDILENA
ncbi:MAG: AAA family ATPase, partial [Bacteroidales bacterium]|nr:AAA family ATPase [Bacteroidales bacterium]